ncbi:MAG: YfhO family protein [Candidatus Krumholzibacteria bacterium]|nr:YfhO family protein [Candidatus Krumholzibacteria bacterium]
MANDREPGRTFDPVTWLDSAANWQKGLVLVVFLVIVLCLLVPDLIFSNKIFLVPDTKAPISFSEVGKQELTEGTYPLWNPYLFCGMPSYQSLSYTPYVYPPAFLTYILQEFMGFPEMTWLLIHYLMAGVGIYLLVRSFDVRSSIAIMAGAIFMIMPNFIAVGAHGHGSQACSTAYIPFALLFCRNILSGRSRLLNSGLLAVALGFQMLRGHIQISYYTYLIIGFFVLLHSVCLARDRKWKELAGNIGLLVFSMVLALGISSVLVFPVRAYADYSIRGGDGGGLGYDYATGWSLHPREMLTFIFPWSYGFGKGTYWGSMPFTDYPNYLGVITAVFSLLAMTVVRTRWKWYFFSAAVLATLISFGRFFPVLYDPMFRFMPFFNKFRVPVMILIVQQVMFVVLMALGIEEYIRLSSEDRLPAFLRVEKLKWVLIAMAALLVIVLVAGNSIQDGLAGDTAVRGRVRPQMIRVAASSFATDLVRTLFIVAAVVGILFVASWKRLKPGLVITFLALLALFDMITIDHSVLRPEKTWASDRYRIIQKVEARDSFKEENKVAPILAFDDSMFRVFPVPYAKPGSWSHNAFPFSDNSYMISGVFSLGGYHAAKLKNYQDVMDVIFASFNRGRIPDKILNMLGAKYFVSLQPLSWERFGYTKIHEEEGNNIYLNPAALPRVFFVDRIKVMTKDEALTHLVSSTFDPSSEVLLQAIPEGTIDSAVGSSAEITDYRLNSIKINANVDKSCIMVLSEIDYPDWTAEIDGEKVPVITADYCLRAIVVGPGEHEVVFRYESPLLKRSLIVSVISLLISLLAVGLSRFFPARKVA